MVPVLQLLAQSLVECQRTRLGAAVINHLTQGHETGHTGNGDNMAVVLLDHSRQKLAHRQEMRQCVDLERLPDLRLWLVEDRAIIANTGIVHQDSGITVC